MPFVFNANEGLLLHQDLHRIGELDFSARSTRLIGQQREDFRLQNIAARNDEVGRRIGHGGLFYHAIDAEALVVALAPRDHAVG